MAKITKLSPEQVARFPELVREWTNIGLCTAPADRPSAERSICEMYRLASLGAPKIVWCGSPLSNGLTRAAVLNMGVSVRASVRDSVRDSVGDSVRDSVGDSVWASVRDSVGDSVRDSVGDSVWDSVRDSVRDSVGDSVGASVRASVWVSVRDSVWDSVGDSVRDSVRDSVWASVGDSVWDSVGASVRDSVRDSVGDSVRDSVRDSVYGQHDAGWLGFYAYFAEVCGLRRQTNALAGLWGLARSSGWALPHKNICWISERPKVLRRDDNGRAHSADGPAIEYPDGWRIFAIHGTLIPAEWIECKDKLTGAAVLAEPNAEKRRAGCELLGWHRVLADLNAEVIDQDEDPLIGTLVSVNHPQIGREKFLRVRCGTGREFAIPVPPEMTSALQANAWSYGLEATEYKPEVRT